MYSDNPIFWPSSVFVLYKIKYSQFKTNLKKTKQKESLKFVQRHLEELRI